MDSAPATSRRPRDGRPTPPLRAVIAVLALYAFVLQAFLGGLMPIPAAADGLCAQHTVTDAAPGKPLPHHHGDCCTAAQAAGSALPARTVHTPVAWTTEQGDSPAYRSIDRHCPRAPPDRSASPRGPPSA
jgi:hypothetical protein